MKLSLIAEGSTKWQRFIRRWGVAFLLGDEVLFDTFGDAEVFWRNLKGIGAKCDRIKHVVISHDHWDHTGGLWRFLDKYKDVTVYICPGFGAETKSRLTSLGVRVAEVAAWREIIPGVYLTGEIKGIYAGKEIAEQAVVVRTPKGLAVVTGCAHPGILTIVDEVRKRFNEPIFFVVGGFHLKDATPHTVNDIIRSLKLSGVRQVAPMHCTGALACRQFQAAYDKGFIGFKVGEAVDLEFSVRQI